MRAWKLVSLLVVAGLIPFGLAQDQWLARWREWFKSVPLAGPALPPLQTYPYNSTGSSSSSSGDSSPNGDTGSSSAQGGNNSNTRGGTSTSSGNSYGTGNNGAARGANSSATSGSTNSKGTGQSWSTPSSSQSSYGGNNSGSATSSGTANTTSNAYNKSGNGSALGNQESKSNANNSQSAGKTDDFESAGEFPGSNDLREVFRFDIHPKWVLGRWPRVTTILSESTLEGLRVPVVTGTTPDDISGALTYYFDTQKVVQRITFQGYTGDEHRLAELVTQGFGMKPLPTLSAGLFMISWNGKPRSALRLTLAPVVRSSDPLHRLEVMLEINRPRAYYGMSREFQDVLEQDRAASRW